MTKYIFGKSEVTFLGYSISSKGYAPLNERVNAILDNTKPDTVEELRRFLGIINFYRHYTPHAAHSQVPLNDYLKNSVKKDKSKIIWTKEAGQAFADCNRKLADITLLAYPLPSAPLTLTTVAFSTSIGAKLEQLTEVTWQPLGFFSRKIGPTYDHELLSIYAAIKFFQHLLDCRNFTIKTDHRPLIYAFKQKHHKALERQLRKLVYISQSTKNIFYVKEEDNTVVGPLSRSYTINKPTTLCSEIICIEQLLDPELNQLLQKSASLNLQQIQTEPDIKIYSDLSMVMVRP